MMSNPVTVPWHLPRHVGSMQVSDPAILVELPDSQQELESLAGSGLVYLEGS